MSTQESQTPLREAISGLVKRDHGVYSVQFPTSVCFGAVVLGGLVETLVHKAAIDLNTTSPKEGTRSHVHAQYLSTHFFRPTMPAPREAFIFLRVAHAARASTTLQFEVKQNEKLNLAGFLLMTNLSIPAPLNAERTWQLHPEPPSVSLDALAADEDPNWVTYLTPWTHLSYRRAQTYMKWSIPRQQASPWCIDQWVSPGWEDKHVATGAAWTNELVHFVLDNAIPTLNDLANLDGIRGIYGKIVKAGLQQGQARRKGSKEIVLGDGLDTDLGWIVSTAATSTEIMRKLPDEGVKWLFMRVVTKSLLNNRTDYNIDLFDVDGHLVAVSHHAMTAISTQQKLERPSVL